MKTRSASLPVLALVAVIALVLGSFGTAVAGPVLTKGAVKKIAAKVVKKQAPALSVASAANATNLAGKPSSAYLDESRVYSTSVTSPVDTVIVRLPVTAGTYYYVSYHAYLSGSSGSSGCYLRKKVGADNVGYAADDTAQSGSSLGFSGSAVVQLAAGQTLELYCFSGSVFTTLAGVAPDPIEVVVTPLDGVTTTVVAPSRPVGDAGRS
jgi:hypothetical protein